MTSPRPTTTRVGRFTRRTLERFDRYTLEVFNPGPPYGAQRNRSA